MYPIWDFRDCYVRRCGYSCSQQQYCFCHSLHPRRCHRRMECVTIEKNDSTSRYIFKILLDVDSFTVKELKVKAKNEDTIIVEGENIEDATKKTPISSMNKFTRVYRVPAHFNAKQAKVTLTADRTLIIIVPEVENVEKYIDIFESLEACENTSNDTKITVEVAAEEKKPK